MYKNCNFEGMFVESCTYRRREGYRWRGFYIAYTKQAPVLRFFSVEGYGEVNGGRKAFWDD